MPKKRRNTKPVPRPAAFGDVFHFDIGYGAGTAIGGIRYALFFVDRKIDKSISILLNISMKIASKHRLNSSFETSADFLGTSLQTEIKNSLVEPSKGI